MIEVDSVGRKPIQKPKEGIIDRLKRRRNSERFVVVPRQDPSINSSTYEVVPEDNPLFYMYWGQFSYDPDRIVDIPKKFFNKDGTINWTKVQLVMPEKYPNGPRFPRIILPEKG